MSLQYVKPHETKYIPKSVGPDKQLLGQSVNRINQLEDQFYATRTQMDEVNHNMLNSMGSLTDEQQNEARGLFEANKQRLDEYVENNGSARASNFARQLASETAREARPYIQRSQEIQEISQIITQAEELEPNERNLLLGDLQRSAESSNLDERLNFRHDKKVIENWENKYDFAERIQKVMNDPDQSNAHIDEQGNVVPNIVMSDGVQRLLKVSGRQADEYHQLLMTEALNDGQMREQLNIMARLRAENGDEFYSNFIDDDGNFDPNKRIIATTNEDGERQLQEGEGNASVNAIEAMATQQFAGISNLMADFSANVSANEFTGGEQNVLGSERVVNIEVPRNNQSASEWYADVNEELKTFQSSISNNISDLKSESGLDIVLDDNNRLVVNNENSEEPITLREYLEQNPEDRNAPIISEVLREHRYARDRISYIEQTKQEHENALLENIINDPILSKYEDAVVFDDQTGKFTFNNRIGEILSENPEDIGNLPTLSLTSLNNPNSVEQIEQMRNGEIIEVDKTITFGAQGSNVQQEVGVDKILVFKRNGRIFNASENTVIREINSSIENTNERIEEFMNSSREITGAQFTEEHKDITKTFMNGQVDLTGKLTDIEGNSIEGASIFLPQAAGVHNGKHFILGTAQGPDGEEIQQNAHFGGRQANDIVRQMMGDDYDVIIRTNQLENYLIEPRGNRQNVSVDLTGNKIESLLGENPFNGANIEIRTRVSMAGGSRQKKYIVDIEGLPKQPFNGNQMQQLVEYLIETNINMKQNS